jgi:hypothetical protein
MQYGAKEEWGDMKQLVQVGARQHNKQQQELLQKKKQQKKDKDDDDTVKEQLKVWQQEQQEMDKVTALLGVQPVSASQLSRTISWHG